MATYFSPNYVEEMTVIVKVKMALRQGEHNREMTFTEKRNGRNTINQLADLILSACDLAEASTEMHKQEEKGTP